MSRVNYYEVYVSNGFEVLEQRFFNTREDAEKCKLELEESDKYDNDEIFNEYGFIKIIER